METLCVRILRCLPFRWAKKLSISSYFLELTPAASQNLAASGLDRWDPAMRALLEGRKALMDHPGRAWLADLTRKNGRLVDVFRRDHAGERIYTCAYFRCRGPGHAETTVLTRLTSQGSETRKLGTFPPTVAFARLR